MPLPKEVWYCGGNSIDALYGNTGGDRIDAAGGPDYLEGRDGADKLSGGSGADLLLGGAGDDELAGGPDSDTLIGGDGEDVYVINSGDGTDTIRDTGRNYIKWNGRLIAGMFEKAGATGFYRFLSTDPALKDLTLTFNSPATLSDGKGAALVFENYQSPEAFDDGDFGITLLEQATPDPIPEFVIMGDDEPNFSKDGPPTSGSTRGEAGTMSMVSRATTTSMGAMATITSGVTAPVTTERRGNRRHGFGRSARSRRQ